MVFNYSGYLLLNLKNAQEPKHFLKDVGMNLSEPGLIQPAAMYTVVYGCML